MTKAKLPRPTNAELEILDVLWTLGPSTVRDVHSQLQQTKPTGYTTVLKLLQIMADKGLVQREAQGRAHVYRASASRERTERQLIEDLAERAFGGSAMALVMRALGTHRATPEELEQVRRLLDEYERREK